MGEIDVSSGDCIDLVVNHTTDVSHKDSISFEILHVVKETQSQHGLKHGDYHRYRQYCSRRLNRLRRSLNYVQSSGKARSTYQPKLVTNQLVTEAKTAKKDPIRYLMIPLMCAERSWAHAMQLKQEANTEPRKKFHMMRKYKKAVNYGNSLQTICNTEPTKCDARTKLEASAYASYLTGLFYFETEEWIKASEFLKKAQTIYEKLFQTIADEEVAAHYKQRCDEIKPTLRYCAFNIGDQNIGAQDLSRMQSEVNEMDDQLLVNKLDQLILQAREKQSVTLSEIQWLGKTISIKQEKIRTFLLLIQDLVIGSAKVSQIEKIIFECRDCLQLLRETNQEKSLLFNYLSYLRLDLTIGRNLQLIKTLQNSSEMIRPFEIIIGSFNEMQSLPLEQFYGSSNALDLFNKQIEAKITTFKAFRCYHIGNFNKNNWKESVALLHRSTQYCKDAINDPNTTNEMKSELKQLMSKSESEKFTLYANNLMKDELSSETKVKTNKDIPPLISRLDTYYEDSELLTGNSSLAEFPPQFKAIPCKPLFFDLALNHIKFPSLETETNPKNTGITGFVKGWLGGWRK
ncbi:signal recognition particle subunit SRP68-like [Oppia nitens]|uniref:signal recognition particle subunit SRP68-like n=1 Tax=Oppia nitens TaxID=1686743 RepID=UPI0023DB2C80|nr:signal recognition particle subunit SRP68-like [Oppia nitens]